MIETFINSIVALIQMVGTKPNIWKIMSTVLMVLPNLLKTIVDFKDTNAKAKFDEFLAAFEAYLAQNVVRAFPHMPIEREAEFWKAIRVAIQDFGYEELKVTGYYLP